MKKPLSQFQRGYAHHRLAFVADLLSLELAESLRRTSLACAENQKKQAGIVEIICGLYLQDRDEITQHFTGDLPAVLSRSFPIHRFGRDGLFPKSMLDEADPRESGFGYSLDYSDDVLQLLWQSAKLAGAVGKRASLKDVVSAVALDREWMRELSRSGLAPSRALADFDQEVKAIVFYATSHAGEGWPREMEFELAEEFRPPYRLEVSTPSGAFQPVRLARVKLNGSEVADVSWPDKPTAIVKVELRNSNRIEFQLDGPMFGSIDMAIRTIAAE